MISKRARSVELRNNADVDEILKGDTTNGRSYESDNYSLLFQIFYFQVSRVKNIPGKIKRNFPKQRTDQ
jgi:hypothetical protein